MSIALLLKIYDSCQLYVKTRNVKITFIRNKGLFLRATILFLLLSNFEITKMFLYIFFSILESINVKAILLILVASMF